MSAVQLQAHSSVSSPENSDTMSRSDVALHEANKHAAFPSHSPVLAKEDEDTHNHSNQAGTSANGHDPAVNGSINNDDATGPAADNQNKSCWSFLTCCFATKTTKKQPTPNYEDPKRNDGIDRKQPKQEQIDLGRVQQNKNEDSKTNNGSAAAPNPPPPNIITQVDPNAKQVLPPDYGQQPFVAIRPPPAKCLLGPLTDAEKGKKTLVLDLDETLVHSSFKPIPNADFVISIELENVIHRVFVLKRPGVDQFLRTVGQKFEVVVFTASLAKYADPLLDILDRSKVVKTRLFREACVHHYGNYVKDLSHLGRRLEDTIIIDNSPFSYMFQPDNAIPITSWFNDKNDRQLYDLLPFLDSLTTVDDVCTLLHRRKQAQIAAGTNMA